MYDLSDMLQSDHGGGATGCRRRGGRGRGAAEQHGRHGGSGAGHGLRRLTNARSTCSPTDRRASTSAGRSNGYAVAAQLSIE
eukprot:2050507-Pleurochrysis_carterae.AAC.3